jgi:hypothetical protein
LQIEVCSNDHKSILHSEPGTEILSNRKGQFHNILSSVLFNKNSYQEHLADFVIFCTIDFVNISVKFWKNNLNIFIIAKINNYLALCKNRTFVRIYFRGGICWSLHIIGRTCEGPTLSCLIYLEALQKEEVKAKVEL